MRRAATAIGILTAFLAVAQSGCVSSVQPLSDAKTSTPDLRLLGEWYQDGPPKETVKLSIARKKDSPNVLQITADDGKEKETVDLFLTKIGDDHFASVEEINADGKKRYLIAKYELLKDGAVKIWVPETEVFAKAVAEKKLKGKVNQPNLFKDVAIDDTSDNLRSFLKQHGTKCFGKETELIVRRPIKSENAKTGK